jgi:hypothetical protein
MMAIGIPSVMDKGKAANVARFWRTRARLAAPSDKQAGDPVLEPRAFAAQAMFLLLGQRRGPGPGPAAGLRALVCVRSVRPATGGVR